MSGRCFRISTGTGHRYKARQLKGVYDRNHCSKSLGSLCRLVQLFHCMEACCNCWVPAKFVKRSTKSRTTCATAGEKSNSNQYKDSAHHMNPGEIATFDTKENLRFECDMMSWRFDRWCKGRSDGSCESGRESLATPVNPPWSIDKGLIQESF